MINLQLGDCVEWAKEYHGEKFHALLTDAPYELAFMGKDWDNTGIAFRSETWAALAEVLHDGAFGMAFASARGWHRMACAIEDAGFVIHPSIFGWAYGSGFPKATRIDTQVDKAAGIEIKHGKAAVVAGAGDRHDLQEYKPLDGTRLHEPQTELAATWAGHRYGLQALKPALEPIIVFQKPYSGKPVDCITRTGAGALWIDGARIGTEGGTRGVDFSKRYTNGIYNNGMVGDCGIEDIGKGRWASNFVLTCAPSCNGTHDESCPSSLLDEQSGDKQSQVTHFKVKGRSGGIMGKVGADRDYISGYTDTGGASRFFFRAQWDALEAADPVRYVAKASRRERDAGLDGFELKDNVSENYGTKKVNLTRKDLGTNQVLPVRNPHPTVKPLALARYLATLLLPPQEYAPRRIFIPFCGVASEAIGAHQAGWDEIVGVEREQEYIDIGNARVKYWTIQMDFLSK